MKKQFALMVALAATISFTSCDDDDDEVSLDEAVSATYEGYLCANSRYVKSMYEEGDTVIVAKGANGTVNVDFSSKTWGDYDFDNAAVADSVSFYYISGNGIAAMASHGSAATKSEYDCSLSAKIAKDAKAGVSTFTISVPDVMGGTTIVITTGETPEDVKAAIEASKNQTK